MRIQHIAMYVSDLEKSREFFERYFGAAANKKYHNEKTGLQTYFLSFDNEVRLEIMTRPECREEHTSEYRLGLTHLAFAAGSKDEVGRLTQRLEKDGYRIKSQPRTTGDGYYESVVSDPDGNSIEITV